MFSNRTIRFLKELEKNNNREWFTANKQGYEDNVRTPALDYIERMATPLSGISPHFVASPRKTGGSLMRVYRDIRFSADKTPYKTNIGIQFRHSAGRDVHAPGFYLHIEPGDCFLAAGMYKPDSPTLGRVRKMIDEYPDEWISLRDCLSDNTGKTNKAKKTGGTNGFSYFGDSLKRPPRGFKDDHPLLDDLKRKHFIVTKKLPQKIITSRSLVEETTRLFELASPLVEFVCDACDLAF